MLTLAADGVERVAYNYLLAAKFGIYYRTVLPCSFGGLFS